MSVYDCMMLECEQEISCVAAGGRIASLRALLLSAPLSINGETPERLVDAGSVVSRFQESDHE